MKIWRILLLSVTSQPGFAQEIDCNGNGVPDAEEIAIGTGYLVRPVAAEGEVVPVDLDGDSVIDLVVATIDLSTSPFSGYISVHLGTKDGSFNSARRFALADVPSEIVAVDVDRDTYIDLVVASTGFQSPSNNSGSVTILLGTGTGDFTLRGPYRSGFGAQAIATADFDLDGDLDLVTSNIESLPDTVGSVSILLGDGQGGFGAPQVIRAGIAPPAVTAADHA